MKKISLTLLLLVLSSFKTTKTKDELLFKDEYGKLSIKKDFIVVNFDTEKYLYDIRYVQMIVFLCWFS
jgi:cytochrome oxidase Cu insertion factor (SCO1/SenC/PrrC family)